MTSPSKTSKTSSAATSTTATMAPPVSHAQKETAIPRPKPGSLRPAAEKVKNALQRTKELSQRQKAEQEELHLKAARLEATVLELKQKIDTYQQQMKNSEDLIAEKEAQLQKIKAAEEVEFKKTSLQLKELGEKLVDANNKVKELTIKIGNSEQLCQQLASERTQSKDVESSLAEELCQKRYQLREFEENYELRVGQLLEEKKEELDKLFELQCQQFEEERAKNKLLERALLIKIQELKDALDEKSEENKKLIDQLELAAEKQSEDRARLKAAQRDADDKDDKLVLARGITQDIREDRYTWAKFWERAYIQSLKNNIPLFSRFSRLMKIKESLLVQNIDQKIEEALRFYDFSRQFYEVSKAETDVAYVNYQIVGCLGCNDKSAGADFFTTGCKHFLCSKCAAALASTKKCPLCDTINFGTIAPIGRSFFPCRIEGIKVKKEKDQNELSVPQPEDEANASRRSGYDDDDDEEDDLPPFNYWPWKDKELLAKLTFPKLPLKQRENRMRGLLERIGRRANEGDTVLKLKAKMEQAMMDAHRYEAVLQWLLNPTREARCDFCFTPLAVWGGHCKHLVCDGCAKRRGVTKVCPAHMDSPNPLFPLD